MYVAIELKLKADGSLEVSTYKKDTREKSFHSILAVAAVSTHPIHSAVIMNPEGVTLKRETYKHEVPEPEPEEPEVE